MIVQAICALLACGLFGMSLKFPKARPVRMHDLVAAVFGMIAIIGAFLRLPFYPAAVPVPIWVVAATLGILAIASPLAGLAEDAADPGQRRPYSRDRFGMHLLMNSLGATVAVTFVILGREATGGSLGERFSSDFMLNIFLPMSGLLALSFIRWQQVDMCPALEFATASGEPPEKDYYANSLSGTRNSTSSISSQQYSLSLPVCFTCSAIQ